MIVNTYKFFFVIFFVLTKIIFSYLYFLSFNAVDYPSIFDVFCYYDDNSEKEFNLLNSFHATIFIYGCGFGKNLYFFLFSSLQIFLLTFAFSKLYSYKFKYQKAILLVVFFSPTILFFSSPPTKDGIFISLICLGIIFSKQIKHILLFISALIKPYVIGFILLKFKSSLMRISMIFAAFIFFLIFYEEILSLIFVKISIFSINLNLASLIWAIEISLVLYFASSSGILSKIDIFIILSLCLLAIGTNLNVASRLVVVSTLFILAWKTSNYETK